MRYYQVKDMSTKTLDKPKFYLNSDDDFLAVNESHSLLQ